MDSVKIYSDGACSKNPGPGGWACILKHQKNELKLSGGEMNTTNNRMELTAIIEALKALKKNCNLQIFTDSKYIVDSINKGWAKKWQKNNWMKNKREKAQNVDLWQALLSLIEPHNSEFIWVKGHNGHPENELCDKMAVLQCKKFLQKKQNNN